MLVDKKNFKTYDLDNKSTIYARIASEQNVLPKYIYISKTKSNKKDSSRSDSSRSDSSGRDSSGSLQTINIFNIVKTSKLEDMWDIYTKLEKQIPIKSKLDEFNSTDLNYYDYCMLWFIYNLKSNPDPYQQLQFSDVCQNKMGIVYERVTFDWKLFKQNYEIELQTFKTSVDEQTDISIELEKTKPVYSTDTEILKTVVQVEFEVEYDMYQLFNKLEMNIDIPYCILSNSKGKNSSGLKDDTVTPDFYKILKEFKIPENWKYIQTQPEHLYLKVLNVDPELLKIPINSDTSSDDKYYSNVEIKFESSYDQMKKRLIESEINIIQTESDLQSTNLDTLVSDVHSKLRGLEFPPINKVVMVLETIIHENLDERIIIEKILKLFPDKITNWNSQQIRVNGVFYVPKTQLSFYVLSHLILIDPLFSKILAIDERGRIPKLEYGVKIQFLNTTTIFNMDFGVIDKSNAKLIAKDKNLELDTHYLKIYVGNSRNVLEIDRFKLIFCKLISIYNSKNYGVKIPKLYSEYLDIDTYMESESEKVKSGKNKYIRKNKLLKDINPEQFISGYARYGCQRESAPKIIAEKTDDSTPAEITELQNQDYQIMVFPKDPTEGKQYYYACTNNSRYKFPGLKRNKLSNNEKYPVFPCCYSTDHANRKQSLLKKYYKDEMTFDDIRTEFGAKTRDEDKHIFTTNKILPNSRLGVLPKDLETFFKTIDSLNTYFRRGFNYTKSTILEALNFVTKKNDLADDELRGDIALYCKNKNINTSQESFNYSTKTLYEILGDEDKFVDVKLFHRLLELYFKCKIFIFCSNTESPYGVLSAPYFLQNYFQSTNKNPVVLVYEHWGGETDNAHWPQYEIIVQSDKLKSFEPESELITRLQFAFNQMWGYPNPEINNTSNLFINKPVKCGNDYYGKTRFISFDFNKTEICVLTQPLPPLNLPRNYKYRNIDSDIAVKFLNSEKVKYTPVVLDKSTIGFKWSRDGIQFYLPIIPIKNTRMSNDTNVEYFSPSMDTNKGVFHNYLDLDKLSRLLVEYMLFMFSKYYMTKSGDGYKQIPIDDSFIVDFATKHFLVDDEFQYDLSAITRNFTINSPVISGNKIIVPNQLVLKKLIYVLQVKLRDNYNETINYQDLKYIPNFYNDIRDFIKHPNEVLISGQNNLIKWIEDKSNNYNLYDGVKTQSNTIEDELMKIYLQSISREETSGVTSETRVSKNVSGGKKLAVIVFYAEWNKMSKLVQNRIFDIFGKNKKYTDLSKQYKNVAFVYIDIDKNKSLAHKFNISVIPFFLVYKLQRADRDTNKKDFLGEAESDNKFTLVDKILGSEKNLFENIKRIKNSIDKNI